MRPQGGGMEITTSFVLQAALGSAIFAGFLMPGLWPVPRMLDNGDVAAVGGLWLLTAAGLFMGTLLLAAYVV